MKKTKKQNAFIDEALSRRLDWPLCTLCDLPSRTLYDTQDGNVCVQCHYINVVRAESRSLADVIEALQDHGLCAYCGEYAGEVEHVVPRRAHLATYTVPACGECNRIASGHLFDSFDQKHTYIRNGLRKVYRKVLQMPEWDEEELKGMSKSMKHMITTWDAARRIISQRLSWEPRLLAHLEAEDAREN